MSPTPPTASPTDQPVARSRWRSLRPAVAVAIAIAAAYTLVVIERGVDLLWAGVLGLVFIVLVLAPFGPFWVAARRDESGELDAESSFRFSWKLLWTGLLVSVGALAVIVTKIAVAESAGARVRHDAVFDLWAAGMVTGLGAMYVASLLMTSIAFRRRVPPDARRAMAPPSGPRPTPA